LAVGCASGAGGGSGSDVAVLPPAGVQGQTGAVPGTAGFGGTGIAGTGAPDTVNVAGASAAGSGAGGAGGGAFAAGAGASGTSGGGGTGVSGTAGTSAGGAGGTGAADAGISSSVMTSADPRIPEITGECPTFQSGTISFGGVRSIRLEVGAKKQGTGSIIFYWHGTGSSSGEYSRMMGGVVQKVLAEGGIIVSPQDSVGTGGDCSGTSTFSKDDFKWADQLYACAVRDHGIDPRRVYTTGCSAGGLQAGCMAAMRSSYVAAAVPNSGGIVFPQPIEDSSHVPAIMTVHGGSSDVVIVTFSQTSATLDKQMKDAGGFVVNCNHGGGHCGIPSAAYEAGWEFMKAHPFGVDPEPYASGLPGSFPDYCEVY
jgi:hypothetical protein